MKKIGWLVAIIVSLFLIILFGGELVFLLCVD